MKNYYYIPFNPNATLGNDASRGSDYSPAGTLVIVDAGETPEVVVKKDGTTRTPQRITRREAYKAFGADGVEWANDMRMFDW